MARRLSPDDPGYYEALDQIMTHREDARVKIVSMISLGDGSWDLHEQVTRT